MTAPVLPGSPCATNDAPRDPALWEVEHARLIRRLALAFLALGLLWRAVRYALRFPVWGDEAMLCLNLLDYDYVGLTQQLQYGQIAPVLFLWGELTALRWLGPSELAIRLLPFLAGLASLVLCHRLARLTLRPLAAALATGLLAVSLWPVSMCTQAKPYSFDLFWSLALLVPAVCWLRRPGRHRWLALPALAVAPAVLCSYPAVFVAGAVSLALAPAVWRQRCRASWALYAGFNLLLVSAFLGNYLLVSQRHLASPQEAQNIGSYMRAYWAHAFPPASFLPLLKWLLFNHTGQMLSYPLGAERGGSSVTALLCLVGLVTLGRRQRPAVLVLLLGPFALNFAAAALHRYPYGVPRLSQHLAPAVVLLAATGAATLLGKIRSERTRRRRLVAVCVLLGLFGAGGMARDFLRPGRDESVLWLHRCARDVVARTGDGPLVVLHDRGRFDAVFRWYLETQGRGVAWQRRADLDRLGAGTDHVWCLQFRSDDDFGGRDASVEAHGRWVVREQVPYTHVVDPRAGFPHNIFPTTRRAAVAECRLTRWIRRPGDELARR